MREICEYKGRAFTELDTLTEHETNNCTAEKKRKKIKATVLFATVWSAVPSIVFSANISC